LRVHLFHAASGTFDTTDLLSPAAQAHDLLNIEAPASLVLLEVGGAFKYDSVGSVQLTAVLGSKTLLRREVRLQSFLYTDDGRLWVPFVIYATFCGDLQLKGVLLRASHVEATLSTSVHFLCGE